MNKYNTRHGGPYDRGGADCYYGRGRNPHYFVGDTYNSPEVREKEMTVEEIEAYNAGYDDWEKTGERKDYG